MREILYRPPRGGSKKPSLCANRAFIISDTFAHDAAEDVWDLIRNLINFGIGASGSSIRAKPIEASSERWMIIFPRQRSTKMVWKKNIFYLHAIVEDFFFSSSLEIWKFPLARGVCRAEAAHERSDKYHQQFRMSFNMKFISKRFSKKRQRHNCDNDERRSRLSWHPFSPEKTQKLRRRESAQWKLFVSEGGTVGWGWGENISPSSFIISHNFLSRAAPSLVVCRLTIFHNWKEFLVVLMRLGAENRVWVGAQIISSCHFHRFSL